VAQGDIFFVENPQDGNYFRVDASGNLTHSGTFTPIVVDSGALTFGTDSDILYTHNGTASVVVSNAASGTVIYHDDVFIVGNPADTTAAVRFDVGNSVPTATTAVAAAGLLVRRSLTTVTAAQVLALHTTPITLVAAPGSGYINEFVSAYVYKAAGTAYAAIATTDDFVISYTDENGEEVARLEATGFADSTAVQARLVLAQSPAQDTATTIIPVDNAVLCISLTGAITTGDSDLLVEVLYRVRKLIPA